MGGPKGEGGGKMGAEGRMGGEKAGGEKMGGKAGGEERGKAAESGKGERGDKGERAEKGERGDKGDRADKGERGDRGDRADKGDRGDKGERADRGDRGDKGERGERGERGRDRAERGGERVTIRVGGGVPEGRRLAPLRPALIERYPQYRGYEMFVENDEIVIVDPGSQRIVRTVSEGTAGMNHGAVDCR